MKIRTILSLFFVLFLGLTISNEVFSQSRSTGSTNGQFKDPDAGAKKLTDKLFLGGTIGGNISSFNNGGYSFFDFSPIIGYKITPKFVAGAGPIYNFLDRSNSKASHIWGAKLMTRYDIINNFFAQVDIETMRFNQGECKRGIRRLPVGGGIRQRMGGNLFLSAMVQYDVLYFSDGGLGNTDVTGLCAGSNLAFYGNNPLIYRFGFNLGF